MSIRKMVRYCFLCVFTLSEHLDDLQSMLPCIPATPTVPLLEFNGLQMSYGSCLQIFQETMWFSRQIRTVSISLYVFVSFPCWFPVVWRSYHPHVQPNGELPMLMAAAAAVALCLEHDFPTAGHWLSGPALPHLLESANAKAGKSLERSETNWQLFW